MYIDILFFIKFHFSNDFMSDFDLMMAKKKAENSKRRKRRDVDLISDSDDLIADIIAQMRLAAEVMLFDY